MYKIYKGNNVVVEGESPLEITGVGPAIKIPSGEYQVVRVEDGKESQRVDIPSFSTLPTPTTSLALSPKTSSAVAGTAGSRKLTATVLPTNETTEEVNYSISPTTAGLAVSDSGLITWTEDVPAGEYTTTAVAKIDHNIKDTHVLTLKEPETPPEGE